MGICGIKLNVMENKKEKDQEPSVDLGTLYIDPKDPQDMHLAEKYLEESVKEKKAQDSNLKDPARLAKKDQEKSAKNKSQRGVWEAKEALKKDN